MQIELYVNNKINVFYRYFDDFVTVACIKYTIRNDDHTFILIFLSRNCESLMKVLTSNAHTAGGQLNMNGATL